MIWANMLILLHLILDNNKIIKDKNMSEWNFSIVLVCTENDQVDSNKIGEILGYGPNTFSLPAGQENGPITHYYNHTYAAQAFVDMINNLGQGTPPEGLPTELLPALSRMIIDINDGGDPVQHTSEVLSSNNLVRI